MSDFLAYKYASAGRGISKHAQCVCMYEQMRARRKGGKGNGGGGGVETRRTGILVSTCLSWTLSPLFHASVWHSTSQLSPVNERECNLSQRERERLREREKSGGKHCAALCLPLSMHCSQEKSHAHSRSHGKAKNWGEERTREKRNGTPVSECCDEKSP